MRYKVIRDTREKPEHGWFWDESPFCAGTQVKKLDQGDYSIEGYEGYIIIERKGSVSEFANNVTQERFTNELERSRAIKYVWILLEFTANDVMNYPVGSGIPKAKWKSLKFNGSFILRRIFEIMIEYPNVKIIFCGDRGKTIASSIFKRTCEEFDRARARYTDTGD